MMAEAKPNGELLKEMVEVSTKVRKFKNDMSDGMDELEKDFSHFMTLFDFIVKTTPEWDVTLPIGEILPGSNVIIGKMPVAGTNWTVENVMAEADKRNLLIQSVISLSASHQSQGVEAWSKYGVTHVHQPFYGRLFPKREMIEKMVKVLAAEDESCKKMDLIQGKIPVVFLHCTRGVDRSALIWCEMMKEKGKYGQDVIETFTKARGLMVENQQIRLMIVNGYNQMIQIYPNRQFSHVKGHGAVEGNKFKNGMRELLETPRTDDMKQREKRADTEKPQEGIDERKEATENDPEMPDLE